MGNKKRATERLSRCSPKTYTSIVIHYTKIFLLCIYVSLKWKHSRLRSILIAFLFSILEEKEKEMNRHVMPDGRKADVIAL